MTPNKENIRRVVEDLRSGKFEQTQGTLHRLGDGRCCLGVACHTARKAGVQLERGLTSKIEYDRDSDDTVDVAVVAFDEEQNYLPAAVNEWLGLPGERELMEVGEDEGILDFRFPVPMDIDEGAITGSHLNDEGFTFDQIADMIEYFYLGESC